MGPRQSPFGPSVALARAVAAVNAAGPPAGELDDARFVAAFAAVLREFGEEGEDDELFPFLGELRDVLCELHSVLAAPDAATAASRLNELLGKRTRPLRLVQETGAAWHLHADSDPDHPAEWLAASSLLAMAVQFAEQGEPPWGACQASGCARFYVAGGPGRPRTTCSPACATRKRQAEFRARQRG